MAMHAIGHRFLVSIVLAGALALAACAPAAAPQPTAAPAKPAAQPTAAPAQPAAQPTTAPAQPAAQPTTAPAAAKAAIELRAGSGFPKGHLIDDGVEKFAELVKQKTNGEVVIRNFNNSLGTQQQLVQSVMSGSIDMGEMSNSNTSRFSTAFTVFDAPFLFKDYMSSLKVLSTPIGKKVLAQMEKDLGVKYLWTNSYASGRDIQTRNKQLKTPADIKGMKIRVTSAPIEMSTFQAWGANPTPVDWGQTFAALQQGVVDGVQVQFSALLAEKVYEVVKYVTILDYQCSFENMVMNEKKFQSLSPQHQKAILDSAQEAQVWQWKRGEDDLDNTKKELTKLGMQIYKPTSDEYAQWASVREKVWEDAVKTLGADKFDLALVKEIYQAQQ